MAVRARSVAALPRCAFAPLREISAMQQSGKNHSGYRGQRVDIRAVLRDVEMAAAQSGWECESFLQTADFRLLALHRQPHSPRASHPTPRAYISTGIHGDEPAGPLAALHLLRENTWPPNLELWLCPCLNPTGFVLNRRENSKGVDLNRQYRHLEAEETRTHVAWLQRQPGFDLCLCLHEDWESQGFYVYELNPEDRPSLAEAIIVKVAEVCLVDPSEMIEGRQVNNGIIRPDIDPRSRPDWPEAFYLITHKTRLSYTLEAPSDFRLSTRVAALTAGVAAALRKLAGD